MLGQPVANASNIKTESRRVQADAAKLLPSVDRRKAKRRRFAQNIDRKVFVPVPLHRHSAASLSRAKESAVSRIANCSAVSSE